MRQTTIEWKILEMAELIGLQEDQVPQSTSKYLEVPQSFARGGPPTSIQQLPSKCQATEIQNGLLFLPDPPCNISTCGNLQLLQNSEAWWQGLHIQRGEGVGKIIWPNLTSPDLTWPDLRCATGRSSRRLGSLWWRFAPMARWSWNRESRWDFTSVLHFGKN